MLFEKSKARSQKFKSKVYNSEFGQD